VIGKVILPASVCQPARAFAVDVKERQRTKYRFDKYQQMWRTQSDDSVMTVERKQSGFSVPRIRTKVLLCSRSANVKYFFVHAMTTFWRSRRIAPFMLNLDTR